mmetsp:Transcript_13678/g.17225  ORF Transcript_13678/g.17225 Transcript_13678/m.17225 type:complete len:231 (-) Transcript_13678:41-733(-)
MYICNRKETQRSMGILCLNWEEGLYLIDQHVLTVLVSWETDNTFTLPTLYSLCFPRNSLFCFAHWASFCNLKRLGFVVRRISDNRHCEVEIDTEEQHSSENTPQKHEQMLENEKSCTKYSKNCFYDHSPSAAEEISQYDVYKPRQSFSKRKPGESEFTLQCFIADQWNPTNFIRSLCREKPLLAICDNSLKYSYLQVTQAPNSAKDLLTQGKHTSKASGRQKGNLGENEM